MFNFIKSSKAKKITITSIISIVFITIALVVASQPKEEGKIEETTTEIIESEKDGALGEETIESEVEVEELAVENDENVSETQINDADEVLEQEVINNTQEVIKPSQSGENGVNQDKTQNVVQNNSQNSNSSSSSNTNTSSKPQSNSSSSNSNSSNNSTVAKPETQKPVVEEVKPVEPQPVKVQSVTTNGSSITLEIGQSKQMTVNVSPANADNKAVTFSSSNTAVATVDANGNIKAIGAGTTVIKATSVENSNIFVGIAVTVNPKVVVEEVKKPTFTGDSIVARLHSNGWYGSGTTAFLAGDPNASADWRDVSVSSIDSGDMDVRIKVFDSSAPGVVSGVEQVIRWMMPNQGQQVINKLHDSSYYGGTLTNIDGRKVVIALHDFGIVIDIYAKY